MTHLPVAPPSFSPKLQFRLPPVSQERRGQLHIARSVKHLDIAQRLCPPQSQAGVATGKYLRPGPRGRCLMVLEADAEV